MTIKELIEELENYDEGAEVRLATQPNYPFENSILETEEIENIVYIKEGHQIGYYPGEKWD
jgi:hypothetical protein